MSSQRKPFLSLVAGTDVPTDNPQTRKPKPGRKKRVHLTEAERQQFSESARRAIAEGRARLAAAREERLEEIMLLLSDLAENAIAAGDRDLMLASHLAWRELKAHKEAVELRGQA
jgi:hypothetical protein